MSSHALSLASSPLSSPQHLVSCSCVLRLPCAGGFLLCRVSPGGFREGSSGVQSSCLCEFHFFWSQTIHRAHERVTCMFNQWTAMRPETASIAVSRHHLRTLHAFAAFFILTMIQWCGWPSSLRGTLRQIGGEFGRFSMFQPCREVRRSTR